MTAAAPRRLFSSSTALLVLCVLPASCRVAGDASPSIAGDSAASISSLEAADAHFRAPSDSAIPAGVLGASIRRGRALLNATRDSLPSHVGNDLRCTSCHLDDGRRANAIPWIGVYARFPQYRARNDAVNLLADRVNDCFERSMNGTPVAPDGRDMKDIVAYLAFLSQGYTVGGDATGRGLRKMAALTPDLTRGSRVYASNCVACHGAEGRGSAAAPPLWGARSYNIGAGMARLRTAASFIRYNMPFGNPTLTDQQAFDVAAYVNSHSRPDFAGKEHDWPRGDAPLDVAYPTNAGRRLRSAAENVPRGAR
jgi:thiosulfate dehydrogenase